MIQRLPLADLNHVVAGLDPAHWEELRSKRIFLTGGTGFFGKWLLESFLHANREHKLGAKLCILTRNPTAFLDSNPPSGSKDVVATRDFPFPPEAFSHVIHAATDASATLNETDPLAMIDVITQGTRRVLEFARHSGAQKFLLTSSGAVHGRQPFELTHLPENYAGAPDLTQPKWAYGEGKRLAELYCTIYHHKFGLETKIARCFAFVGPYLPLDQHFAIGNLSRRLKVGR